jgi:YidC/Oxa1 family membrane protein insertase
MDKRLFIAVIVSVAFLFGWGLIAPRLFPELAKSKASPKTSSSAATSSASTPGTAPGSNVSPAPAATGAAPSIPTQGEAKPQKIMVDQPRYRAVFTNRGAQLTSFQLKDHKEKEGSIVELVKKRPESNSDFPFMLEANDTAWAQDINRRLFHVTQQKVRGQDVITFETRDVQGHLVRKRFELGPDFLLKYKIEVARPNTAFRVMVGPGIRNVSGNDKDTQFITTGNGVYQIDGSAEVIKREKAEKFKVVEGHPEFVGIEDNYFLIALKPQKGEAAVFRSTDGAAKEGEGRKDLFVGLNAAGQVAEGSAFFGPKEIKTLDALGLQETVRFGVFEAIGRVLLVALKYIYQFTHNYGWAIVVLTIFIKILLYPLQHKSIVSMKKMQQVQPKMNAIKEKYRKAKTDPDQRQKMNLEMMSLYQKEGISPMSGCLPILLQLPILWAFYGLLSQAIELRGAAWILWIQDLSVKDPYYITPILMTATMFIQQLITPSSMDPVQKKVLLAMPIVFGWIFKEFPSGLVLYWLVQNILSIIQQVIMNRYWKDHPEALEITTEKTTKSKR